MVERLDFSKLPKGVLVVIDETPTPEQDPLTPIEKRSGFTLITERMENKELTDLLWSVGTPTRRASVLMTAPPEESLGEVRPLEEIPSITVEEPKKRSTEPTIVHFDWPWDAEYKSEVVRSSIRRARETGKPLLLEKNHSTPPHWYLGEKK